MVLIIIMVFKIMVLINGIDREISAGTYISVASYDI